MSTTRANLDVTQYVKINAQQGSVTIQSTRDTVRVVFSDVKPARDNGVYHTLGDIDDLLQINDIDTDVWVLAMSDTSNLVITETSSVVNVNVESPNPLPVENVNLDTSVTNLLPDARVRTSSMSQGEYFSAVGKRFVVDYDEVYAGNETKYILYQMPPLASGYLVALRERRFKSRDADAEIEILWDSTGFTPGTPIPSFNENRNFEIDTGLMIVSEIAPPTTEGTVRELDFLKQVGGNGNRSSGDISAATGSRIYSPDSFFIAKVTNLDNGSNRIKLAYNWAESPISAIV